MLNKRSFSTAWWRKAIPVPRAAAPGKLVEFWDELQRPSDEKYKKRIYRECEYAFVHGSRVDILSFLEHPHARDMHFGNRLACSCGHDASVAKSGCESFVA